MKTKAEARFLVSAHGRAGVIYATFLCSSEKTTHPINISLTHNWGTTVKNVGSSNDELGEVLAKQLGALAADFEAQGRRLMEAQEAVVNQLGFLVNNTIAVAGATYATDAGVLSADFFRPVAN